MWTSSQLRYSLSFSGGGSLMPLIDDLPAGRPRRFIGSSLSAIYWIWTPIYRLVVPVVVIEMNARVSDLKMDNDPTFVLHPLPLPPSNNVGQNNSLIELLSKNGHVDFHNQTHCISRATNSEYKPQKTEYTLKSGGSLGSFMNLIQRDETASWYPNPLDDSVESNFHEEFFGIEIPDPHIIDKEDIGKMCVKLGSTKDTNACME